MKIFVCDKCGTQFDSPLDEERFTDENGNSYTLDMCAPCRGDLNKAREQAHIDFFAPVISAMNKPVKGGKLNG
jgi:hypothetical protein